MTTDRAALRLLPGSALLVALSVAASFAADPPPPLPTGAVLGEPRIPDTVQGRFRSLNEDLSRGLDPARNAAVYFVQLFGAEVFPPALRDASLAMLGIESLPPDGPRLSGFEAFARSPAGRPDDVAAGVLRLQEELAQAVEKPWKAADLPTAAAYLDANAVALDAVAPIVALGRYYAPVLAEESPPRVDAASFDFELRLKAVAPLLQARALRSAGSGDAASAVNDLLTCRALGVLLAEGSPFDVSHAKAHTIDGHAYQGAKTLIEQGRLPPDAAKDFLRRLSASPPIPPAADAADRGERAALEQELGLLTRDETLVRDYLDIHAGKRLTHLERTRLKDLDWGLAGRRAAEIHDAVVAALRIGPHRPQAEAFAALGRDYDAWKAKSDALYRPGGEEVVDMDVAAASRWVGETVAMSLRGNPWQRRVSDDRAKVRLALVRIGLALTAAAADRGAYPASLDELRPAYFDEVPPDAYAEAPFTYLRRDDGTAALISRGPNREDDANRIYNDDTVLELPAPARAAAP